MTMTIQNRFSRTQSTGRLPPPLLPDPCRHLLTQIRCPREPSSDAVARQPVRSVAVGEHRELPGGNAPAVRAKRASPEVYAGQARAVSCQWQNGLHVRSVWGRLLRPRGTVLLVASLLPVPGLS